MDRLLIGGVAADAKGLTANLVSILVPADRNPNPDRGNLILLASARWSMPSKLTVAARPSPAGLR